MPNSTGDKSYFNFSAGLNSDASPVVFPENFSVDEQNFEILKDATRRRRRGIYPENIFTGGYTPPSVSTTYACRTHKWSDVSGDPNTNFIVIQYGSTLHFYRDTQPVGSNKIEFTVDLTKFVTNSSLTSLVATIDIDAAFGRGHFFVTHKLLNPFYIKYNAVTQVFEANEITIKERDFEGVDDGITSTSSPASNTDSHRYNLHNRGWLKKDIDAYFTSKSLYPSKNMIPSLGYRRTTTASVAESDWTKAFSPDKLIAELFQDASAPIGHFIRDPFVTNRLSLADAAANIPVSSWTISGTTGGTQTITITTATAHGMVAGNRFWIEGHAAGYASSFTGGGGTFSLNKYYSLDGWNTVTTAPTTTSLTITITFPSDFLVWTAQFQFKGTIQSTYIDNPYGYATDYRPTCVEFYAGRLWFTGTPHEKVSTKIFYSQVIESDGQYGKCYQVADPTDENISDLVDTDGGVITIPEAANIHYIMAFSGSLLVFASNGVWAVAGGQSGYFTATSYAIRKISDIGSTGAGSIVLAENIPMYWSTSGIYAFSQDANSGFISVQSISVNKIDSFYRDIPYLSKQKVQCTYDDIEKRVYWLYSSTSTTDWHYDSALVFNLKFLAFSPWKIYRTLTGSPAYTTSIFTVRDTGSYIRLKFVGIYNGKLHIADTSANTYADWNSGEEQAYVITGYDTLETPQYTKYAPYITVFQNKTETGFTTSFTDLVPVGESSLTMQAQWDWTDRTTAGKWGSAQQVYRHRRLYTPVDASDTFDNGETLVITRNKVRGRGRCLSIKFTVGTGKDSWLLGWTIRWVVNGTNKWLIE